MADLVACTIKSMLAPMVITMIRKASTKKNEPIFFLGVKVILRIIIRRIHMFLLCNNVLLQLKRFTQSLSARCIFVMSSYDL